MKRIILFLITLFVSTSMVHAQTPGDISIGAAPSVTSIPVGGTAIISTTMSNTGFDTIPVGALQVSVSFPIGYYKPDASNPPTGTNASFFTWTFLAPDTWTGENNTAIAAGQSVYADFPVTGVAITPSDQQTNLSIGATPSTSWSDNNPTNNNTLIAIGVIAPTCTTPAAPTMSASTTIKSGSNTSISASCVSPATMAWTAGTTGSISPLPVSPTATTTYSATCTSGTCVSNAASTTVTVTIAPVCQAGTVAPSVF